MQSQKPYQLLEEKSHLRNRRFIYDIMGELYQKISEKRDLLSDTTMTKYTETLLAFTKERASHYCFLELYDFILTLQKKIRLNTEREIPYSKTVREILEDLASYKNRNHSASVKKYSVQYVLFIRNSIRFISPAYAVTSYKEKTGLQVHLHTRGGRGNYLIYPFRETNMLAIADTIEHKLKTTHSTYVSSLLAGTRFNPKLVRGVFRYKGKKYYALAWNRSNQPHL